MTHGYYRPGWKFYEVIWEREGERLATAALHAADEADLFSVAFQQPNAQLELRPTNKGFQLASSLIAGEFNFQGSRSRGGRSGVQVYVMKFVSDLRTGRECGRVRFTLLASAAFTAIGSV